MIYGIGIDIVQIKRIEQDLERWGERFTQKVFTPGEIDYCLKKKTPSPNFAARFAAKEAFVKALGIGIRRGIHWKDVEVTRGPLGKPVLRLSGQALQVCAKEKIAGVFVSLTHDREYSSAIVVLEAKDE
ncbi:MAG: holo-ACP synthase [Deltaproteobacteria bacterium]|nr:holo-ACP synthase [Deltaproteobacteria bacterium]